MACYYKRWALYRSRDTMQHTHDHNCRHVHSHVFLPHVDDCKHPLSSVVQLLVFCSRSCTLHLSLSRRMAKRLRLFAIKKKKINIDWICLHAFSLNWSSPFFISVTVTNRHVHLFTIIYLLHCISRQNVGKNIQFC